MDKPLPARPDLAFDRKAARALQRGFEAGEAEARERVRQYLPRLQGVDDDTLNPASLKLTEAQLVVAREHGFESWPKLVAHIEAVSQAVAAPDTEALGRQVLLFAESLEAAKSLLAEHPEIARSSIFAAAAAGDPAALAWHLERDPASATRRGGQHNVEPLVYTCFSRMHQGGPEYSAGLCECARLLLDAGADPNAYYTDPDWPDSPQACLYGATGHGNHPALARLLLEAGAKTEDGESIYHSAQFFYEECLELLAEFGADFGTNQQPWNNTPLYFILGYHESDAARPTADKGVKWLLEHGADPNVPSYPHRSTPLILACRNGRNAGMIRLLLEHGADPSYRNAEGLTPYGAAMLCGNLAAAEVLREAGADTGLSLAEELLAACSRGDEAAARALAAAHEGLLGSLSPAQLTALPEAAGDGNTAAVRIMLGLGLDPGLRGDGGATALHAASWRGRHETVEEILRHSPPLEALDDNYNATPLQWAVHGSQFCESGTQGDYPRIVRALLAAGSPLPTELLGSPEVRAILRAAGVPESQGQPAG